MSQQFALSQDVNIARNLSPPRVVDSRGNVAAKSTIILVPGGHMALEI